MKSIISITLLFALLFSTIGVTMAKSYCNMKKAAIEKQGCCKKKCKTDCCTKTVKVFKLHFDSTPSAKYQPIKIYQIASPLFFNVDGVVKSCIPQLTFSYKPPPPLPECFEPSFTEVFRI
jgi:hypothetical protein